MCSFIISKPSSCFVLNIIFSFGMPASKQRCLLLVHSFANINVRWLRRNIYGLLNSNTPQPDSCLPCPNNQHIAEPPRLTYLLFLSALFHQPYRLLVHEAS